VLAAFTNYLGMDEKTAHGLSACFIDRVERKDLVFRALARGRLSLWKEEDRYRIQAKRLSDKVCNTIINNVVEYLEGIPPLEIWYRQEIRAEQALP